MKRALILLASLLPLSLVSAQGNPDKDAKMKFDYALFTERSRQINELAGNMHSMDDSRRLVDLIAAVFVDDLPPAWSTRSIRERIAQAEYESATDRAKLVPEQRVVYAWNRYLATIGASQEAFISAAEIHNLRDSSYSMARFMGVEEQRPSGALRASTPQARMEKWPTAARL